MSMSHFYFYLWQQMTYIFYIAIRITASLQQLLHYQQIKLMAEISIAPATLQQPKLQTTKIIQSQPNQLVLDQNQKPQSLTHHKKRKRKHHKKHKIVRDPQEIKSIRLERLNIKREVHWDNRFVNETIPDLFRPKKRRTQHSRPLHSAYVQKERPKLPQIRLHQTAAKNNHKAFKIRQIKKESQTAAKQKEEELVKDVIEEKDEKERTKKISKKEKNKQRLLLKLEEKTKIFPINKHYNTLLVDLINKATDKKQKSIRTSIQKQIDLIGGNDNAYSKMEKMVQERTAQIKSIKSSGADATLKSFLDCQIHSLSLIEQILKFKAFWQAIYHDTLHTPTKVNFYYEQSNYLLEMKKEVADLSENDPFLVEKTALLQKLSNSEPKEQQLQERKEMMLKIRACELLLIQEELHASL